MLLNASIIIYAYVMLWVLISGDMSRKYLLQTVNINFRVVSVLLLSHLSSSEPTQPFISLVKLTDQSD